MSIIAFCGKAGAGKDTAANTILHNPRAYYKKFSFAAPIKQGAAHLFGLTTPQLEDTEEKEKVILDEDGKPRYHINGKPATPRLIMQWLGTDIMRNMISDDFWIQSMKYRIKNSLSLQPNSGIIITDCRFENEMKFIKEMGGIIIQIKRHNLTTMTNSTEHASENSLNESLVDHVIINDGTIEDLEQKVEDIMRDYCDDFNGRIRPKKLKKTE